MIIKKDWRYKLAHFPDTIYIWTSKFIYLILVFNRRIIEVWQNYFSVWDNNKTYQLVRKFSFPLHHIWIGIFKRLESKKKVDFDIIDDTEGLQIIGGNTGSGKSTLLYDVAEKDRIHRGKPWYLNTLIEKPRFSIPHNAMVRYHRFMPFENVFSDWKMQIYLDNSYGGYGIDEIHRIFDYRINQTDAYMSKFTPFRDYAVLIRKHIKKMIGLTQMDRLDIQLMYLVKYWHKPRIDIGFDYEDWMLESGIFRFKVKGWWIDTYDVDTSNGSNMLVFKERWYRKAIADYDYFDTYAFNDAYDHVKKDNLKQSYV